MSDLINNAAPLRGITVRVSRPPIVPFPLVLSASLHADPIPPEPCVTDADAARVLYRDHGATRVVTSRVAVWEPDGSATRSAALTCYTDDHGVAMCQRRTVGDALAAVVTFLSVPLPEGDVRRVGVNHL
jgi:hypothetical protein